jgi:hypothetical protein
MKKLMKIKSCRLLIIHIENLYKTNGKTSDFL